MEDVHRYREIKAPSIQMPMCVDVQHRFREGGYDERRKLLESFETPKN
jgi:hypothetical protein